LKTHDISQHHKETTKQQGLTKKQME
jgi:hypothetical protein